MHHLSLASNEIINNHFRYNRELVICKLIKMHDVQVSHHAKILAQSLLRN